MVKEAGWNTCLLCNTKLNNERSQTFENTGEIYCNGCGAIGKMMGKPPRDCEVFWQKQDKRKRQIEEEAPLLKSPDLPVKRHRRALKPKGNTLTPRRAKKAQEGP